MELHPVLFAVIAYVIAIFISLCVALIIKLIALVVRGKGKDTTASAEKEA